MSPEPPMSRTRIDSPGTYNFREAAPGALRPGVLYRSDALHRLNGTGRRMLGELGVRRIIDLRADIDRRFGGRDRLAGVDAEYFTIPISGVGRRVDPATLTLQTVYRTILDDFGLQVGAAIRAIADADGAVVVHCTAGKDRTGLVVALTLVALDVDFPTVAADYTLSQTNLAGPWATGMLRKARLFRVTLTDDLVTIISGAPERELRETLNWLDEKYGGVVSYLEHVGVGGDVLDRLRLRLALP
jgi:protein-tyrosine phosphatase